MADGNKKNEIGTGQTPSKAQQKVEEIKDKMENAREHLSEPLRDMKGRARDFTNAVNSALPEDFSRAVDQQIGALPSIGFLGIALGAMGISATLALFNERKGFANFFGNWVPTLLFLTVYSKLIKVDQAIQEQAGRKIH